MKGEPEIRQDEERMTQGSRSEKGYGENIDIAEEVDATRRAGIETPLHGRCQRQPHPIAVPRLTMHEGPKIVVRVVRYRACVMVNGRKFET